MKFISKTSLLMEEVISKNQTGGYMMSQIVKLKDNIFQHPEIINRPSNYINLLKDMMKSDLNLMISAVKTNRASTSDGGLKNGTEDGAYGQIYLDIVQMASPALYVNPITVPAECVEVINPGGKDLPEVPDSLKYKDKSHIKPETVNIDKKEDVLLHQTLGQDKERNLHNINVDISKIK